MPSATHLLGIVCAILCGHCASAAAHNYHHHHPHYYHYDYDVGGGTNNYVAHHASSHLAVIGDDNHRARLQPQQPQQQPQQHHHRLWYDAAATVAAAAAALPYQPSLPQPKSQSSPASLPVTALLFANHNGPPPPSHLQPHGYGGLPEALPIPQPPPLLPIIPLPVQPAASGPLKTPLDIMVDISNRMAFAVLNAHTEPHSVRRRAQNFAYSPCGLTSVLIALWEGAAGAGGAHEIYRAMRLPWDRDVVRIGVRDMHRRLREYFYADENLLDGLSLNRDNVTIRPDYEAVLRFYGYDLNASGREEMMVNMATTMFHVAATAMPATTAIVAVTTTAPPMPTTTSTIRSATATAVTVPLTTGIQPMATSPPTPAPTITTPTQTDPAIPETTEMITTTIPPPEKSTTTELLTTTTTQQTTSSTTTTTEPPTTTTTTTEPPTTTTTTTEPPTTTTTEPPTTTTTTEPPTTTTTTTEPPTTTTTPATSTTSTQPPPTTTTPFIATNAPPPTTTQPPIIDTTTIFVPLIAQRIPTFVTTTSTPATPIETTTMFVPLIAQRIIPTAFVTSPPSTTPAPSTRFVFTYKPPVSTVTVPATTLPVGTPTSRTSRTIMSTMTTTVGDSSAPISTTASSVTDELLMSMTDTTRTQTSSTIIDEATTMTTPPTTEAITTVPPIESDIDTMRQRRARFRATTPDAPVHSTAPLINRQARRLHLQRNAPAGTNTSPSPPHKRVKKFLHYNSRNYFDLLTAPLHSLVQQRPRQSYYHQSPLSYPPSSSASSEFITKLRQHCCSANNFYYATPNPPVAPYASYAPSVPTAPSYYQPPNYAFEDGNVASHGTAALFAYPAAPVPTVATTTSSTTTTRLPQSFGGLAFTSYAAAANGDSAPPQPTSAHYTNHIEGTDKNTTTSMLPFHIDRRLVVTAPFRVLTAPLRLGYAAAVQASVLELPLETPDYVLLLLLPDVAFDLNGLMQRMTAANRVAPTVREMRTAMRTFWIRATVPLVQLKGSAVLTGDMMKLGVKDIFEPARADFTPMTDETGIYAKHIEQLITLNIQTASGISDVGDSSSSTADANGNKPTDSAGIYNPIEVNVQQPFVFCIVDTQTDLIIMIGQIVNPLSSRIL